MTTSADLPPLKLKSFLLYTLGYANNLFARDVGQFDKRVQLPDEGDLYIYSLKKKEKESDLTLHSAFDRIRKFNEDKDETVKNEASEESPSNPHEDICMPRAVRAVKKNPQPVETCEEEPQCADVESTDEVPDSTMISEQTDEITDTTSELQSKEEVIGNDEVETESNNTVAIPDSSNKTVVEDQKSTPTAPVKEKIAKRKLETADKQAELIPKRQKILSTPQAQPTEKLDESKKKKEIIKKSKLQKNPGIEKQENTNTKKESSLESKKKSGSDKEKVENNHTYSEVAQLKKKIALPSDVKAGSLLNPQPRSKTLEEVCLDVVTAKTSQQDAAKLEQQHRNYLMSIALEGPSTMTKKAFISHDEIKLLLTEEAGLKAKATKIMGQILKRVQTQSEAVHHLTQMNKNIKAGKYSYLTRKQEKILKGKIDKLLKEYFKAKDKQGKQKQRNKFLTNACDGALQQARKIAILEQTGQHHEAARQLSSGNSRKMHQNKKSFKTADTRRAKQQAYGLRRLPMKKKK